MRVLSAADLSRLLDDAALIDRLAEAFRGETRVPPRQHHAIETTDGSPAATLLVMPAWRPGAHIGLKTVGVFPGNAARGLETIQGFYVLLDGTTGVPLALMDARELTARRTACASALASRLLSRPDSHRLLVVGTGKLAPHLARVHAKVRPIDAIGIWGRDPAKASDLAGRLADQGLPAEPADDLRSAVARADVISCATLASEPLIRGAWLRPGQHLDLVGAFRPTMRETDDATITRAEIFCDTREGAMTEGGDLAQPLAAGIIGPEAVRGDLADLCRGAVAGRASPEAVTLFKSVGTALEDLAAAELAWEHRARL